MARGAPVLDKTSILWRRKKEWRKAPEDTWDRTFREIEDHLKTIEGWNIKTEENLDAYVRQLKKRYGMDTPLQELGEAGKPLKPGQQIFKIEEAKTIREFYRRIMGATLSVLDSGIKEFMKMDYDIKNKVTEIGGFESTLKKLKQMQPEIHNEFYDVIEYYDFIIINKKMPSSSWYWPNKMARFNKKPIVEPLNHIKLTEIRLLGLIDRVRRTVKRTKMKEYKTLRRTG